MLLLQSNMVKPRTRLPTICQKKGSSVGEGEEISLESWTCYFYWDLGCITFTNSLLLTCPSVASSRILIFIWIWCTTVTLWLSLCLSLCLKPVLQLCNAVESVRVASYPQEQLVFSTGLQQYSSVDVELLRPCER